MQRSLNDLRADDDPAITGGDDEMAHLRELVHSLQGRNSIRVGKTALTAAAQGFEQRRRILERRGHVQALLDDADPHLERAALEADVKGCDEDLAKVNDQLMTLIESVAHLAASSDQSQTAAIASVRDSADAVNALASAYDELKQQSS